MILALAAHGMDLPEAASSRPAPDPALVIHVGADGLLSVGDGPPHAPPPYLANDPASLAAVDELRSRNPLGVVLVEADKAAPMASICGALRSARGSRVALATRTGAVPLAIDPLAPYPPPPPRLPLVVHLWDDGIVMVRKFSDVVVLHATGTSPLLREALAEDRQLHPEDESTALLVDADVTYQTALVALDAVYAAGFAEVVLTGGGSSAPYGTIWGPAPAQPTELPEQPTRSDFLPTGDIRVRFASGEETIPNDAVNRFEAWCDDTRCDMVAVWGHRRVMVGTLPRENLHFGWLFAREVFTYEGRLDLPAPARWGRPSPFIFVPLETE